MTAITHYYKFSGAGEDFGPRSDGIVTLHTWENGPTDNTVAGMMNDLAWQDGDDVAGSYNRVCCVDGVISAVPDHHASGGINPGSASWAPKAWLYQVLDPDVIRNPNYFTLNLCAPGQRGHYDRYGWPPGIIDGMARSIIDEERRIGRRVVVTNHLDFQSNRTDAGAICTQLVKARYTQLTGRAPLGGDMQYWKPVQEDWYTVVGAPFYDGAGNTKNFTTRERVRSIAESSDNHRLVKYGANELLVFPRASLTPIAGTRVPASGYGFPPPETVIKTVEVPTGITQAQLDQAKVDAAEAEQLRIANAERARIRAI